MNKDFIVIRPLDKPECVIALAHIYELSSSTEEHPARVYFRDPANVVPPGDVAIDSTEYDRLKMELAGEGPTMTAEEFRAKVAEINAQTEAPEKPKKGAAKK